MFIAGRLEEKIAGKPVVLHSVRLMTRLWDYGYHDEALLLAALLHDVLEDSSTTTYSELSSTFRENVAMIVQAVSYNKRIPDGRARIADLFSRTIKTGREACLVKCVDTLDNSFYIRLCSDRKQELYLVDKMRNFLDLSESKIGSEEPWRDLQEQYKAQLNRLSVGA